MFGKSAAPTLVSPIASQTLAADFLPTREAKYERQCLTYAYTIATSALKLLVKPRPCFASGFPTSEGLFSSLFRGQRTVPPPNHGKNQQSRSNEVCVGLWMRIYSTVVRCLQKGLFGWSATVIKPAIETLHHISKLHKLSSKTIQ